MTRDDDTVGREVKTPIAEVMVRVTKKNAGG